MSDLDEIRNKAKAILGEHFQDQPTTERVLFRMVIALCDHIEANLLPANVEMQERVG